MTDAAVERCIFALLAHRRPGATVCPSEVARTLEPEGARWRGLMPQVREVAQQLAQAGRLRVTRGGVPVDATAPGGPIRLGLPTMDGVAADGLRR
nr:DUF3253 domain-containing protein [Variovorax boronicumulans]